MERFGGIGDRIRERLRVLGFWKNGRPDVARFCTERSYRPQYVYAWLRDRVPGPENLSRLSRDLGVSGPWIMFGDLVGQPVAQGVVPMVAEAHGRGRPAAPRGRPRREPAALGAEARRPEPPREVEEPTSKIRIIDFRRLREVTEKLVLLEAELDGILRAFPDLYFLLDADGTILDFKAGRGSDFPLMPDALLGRTVEDVLPGGVGLSLRTAVLEAIRTGALAAQEFSLEGRDERRTYEARFISLEDIPLREKKVLAIVRDMTERKRAEEATRALVEVDKLLTQTVDLDRVLRLVVEKAVELLPAPGSCVFLSEPAEGGVVHTVRQSQGLPPEIRGRIRRAEGEGVIGKAIRERRPVWTADLLTDPGIWLSDEARRWTLGHGIPRAILAAPLVLGDTVIGGLTVYRPAGAAYKPAEIELLAALAAQAAIAIENARLYQGERKRARDLTGLIRAARSIASSADLAQILESVVQSAVELTGASVAALHLLEEGGWLVRTASAGALKEESDGQAPLRRMRIGEGGAGAVAAGGQPLWVPDLAADPRNLVPDFNAAHGMRWYLGMPILGRAGVLGVLGIKGSQAATGTEEQRDLLESLAAVAAIAIERVRLSKG